MNHRSFPRIAYLLVVLLAGCSLARPSVSSLPEWTRSTPATATTETPTPEVARPTTRTAISTVSGTRIPIPPSGKIYHAAFPGGTTDWGEEDDITLNDLRSYEQHVGKTAVVLGSTATVTPTAYLPFILRNSATSSPGWWRPSVNTSWQWQLTALPIDQSFDVDMYDIDLFDNDAGTVAALHAQGRKVVCYVSVGSWEDWRPDKDQFPASVMGNDYAGWPGEKWLDIRQIDLLAPIMRARFDQCQAKGFDGIEPDNIDGYTNDTGFPLTYQDQLNYNIWLANEAHARGLSIGLKNDGDQVNDLLPYFDWAMTEDCFADDWCEQMEPFVAAGKAVFAAEYTDTGIALDQFCPQAKVMGFSAILKHRGLDAWRQACP